MDHRNGMDGFDYDMNQFHDTHPSDPPQIFTAYGPDGHPVPHGFATGPYFAGEIGDGDENDPKRRRIARVPFFVLICHHPLTPYRHATCVGRRRSNAMVSSDLATLSPNFSTFTFLIEVQVNYRNVVIAPITRLSVYSLMSKRREIRRKGNE